MLIALCTVHHRTADRVRAHIFLCMLAYYVEWHMRQAWREFLFSDPQSDQRSARSSCERAALRSYQEKGGERTIGRRFAGAPFPHADRTS